MNAVPTLPPHRRPPGVGETEDDHELEAQPEEGPVSDVCAPQSKHENGHRHTNAALPHMPTPLHGPPQDRGGLDRQGGSEST